jgi:branched-subunit amino acid ABC-type transport system permease component
MRIVRQLLALLLIVLTIPAGSAFADPQHIVDPGQLAAAVAGRVATQDADRAAIRDMLARPEVRDLATEWGLDMTRLTGAVDMLSGADLERAAASARQVDQQLVGGASTITLSTTTIIIILLVLILLIVALR